MAKEKDMEYDEFAKNMAEFAKNYQKAMDELVDYANSNQPQQPSTFPFVKWTEVATDIAQAWLKNPEALYKKQLELATDYAKIWGNVLERFLDKEDKAPLYSSDPRDRRFRDESWQENLIFDFIKQSYLVTGQWMEKLVDAVDAKDPKATGVARFYMRQFIDAMSPSNFAMTNPQVIKETLDSKGQNLVKGMQHLLEDLERSKHSFQVRTTDMDYFKVGENIATTKGKVVFRNDLMELIQYEPLKPKAYETPLLVIPAWINKYYIFDLSPENSFAKWLLEQGHTVFVISWVNPDKSLAHKKFEDYMIEGPLAALDAIEKATGQKQVNAMGYCLGGTLLTCTMAYLEAKKQADRIKSATCLTTLIDFSEAGEMALLTDEDQLEKLKVTMERTGYFDGREMASIFSALRANDLIWSFVINNYLLGREPFPFDIMFWNADCTRLPAATHSYYLSKMYLENAMVKAGGLELDGVPVDVTKIRTPCYLFATQEDHIAPWLSCYKSTKMIKNNTFVLGASGHVSGVVNPPVRQKYSYWVNDAKAASTDAKAWQKQAARHEGSWWNHWQEWIKQHAGKKIDAPKAGGGKLKALADAPGEYVKVKI